MIRKPGEIEKLSRVGKFLFVFSRAVDLLPLPVDSQLGMIITFTRITLCAQVLSSFIMSTFIIA